MRTQIVSQASLNTSQRNRMYNIMCQYYTGVNEHQFHLDLNEKQDVILMLDRQNNIQGFSTLLTKKQSVDGKKFIAIYSGDTVLAREYWGNGALALAFGRYLVKMRLKYFFTPTYWFLISKGYKTYLLMTNNFPEHWPRYDKPTKPQKKKIMDSFYTQLFGPNYFPETGIMIPESSKVQTVKVSVADIDNSLMLNPKIKFFAEQNPLWAQGQELCCVARVSLLVPVKYVVKYVTKHVRKKVVSQ